MTKTVVITSGKGGVGKTNISVNTAVELARLHYRTCLFDADLGLANVNILLGINPEYTLDDFVFNGRPLNDVVQATEFGFDIIPGSSGIEKMANLARKQIAELVAAFCQLTGYDFFLIDTSSGISSRVISFCLAATETILVLTAEPTSLTDAYAILKVLSARNYRGTVNILVNKSESVPQSKNTYLHFKSVVAKHLDIHITPIGVVLNDPHVEEAIVRQRPLLSLYPDTISSQCIRAMVSNLVNMGAKKEGADIGTFWTSFFELIQDEPHSERQRRQDAPASRPEGTGQDPRPAPPEKERKPAGGLSGTALDCLVSCEGLLAGSPLPSPMPLLSYALQLQNSGQLDGVALTHIFTSDPALMGKLLQFFVSRPASRSERNFDIGKIIEHIGRDHVAAVLLNTAVHSALSEKRLIEYSFINSFWHHSYLCGMLAKSLAEQTGYPFLAEAFLSGLLHDIGRLALQVNSPEIYFFSPLCYDHSNDILDAEAGNSGHSHAELGAMILEKWHCNPFIVDAVRYHAEQPAKIATATDLTRLVYVAQRLCDPALDTSVAYDLGASLLQLSPRQIMVSKETAGEETARRARDFNISLIPIESNDEEDQLEYFKQQALDYSMLSGILPRYVAIDSCDRLLPHIHRGAQLLFGISKIICLFPDKGGMHLQAGGYSDCLGKECLANIVFSLNSQKSLIVRSFSQGKLLFVENGEVATLADRQLLELFRSRRLLCVPLGANGRCKGVMVAGIEERDRERLNNLQGRLLQFGMQAASAFQ